MHKTNLSEINSSLEEKSWFFQKNFLENDLCDLIFNSNDITTEESSFFDGKIGNDNHTNKNISIRNGSMKWIDYWDGNSSLQHLNSILLEIMLSTNNYFRLSLKRFESQFAIYNKGGFYKTHLDQHKETRHRQMSCCLYLNDCEEGGELIIYKKGSKTEIDEIIRPLKGSLVLFFSADIYHEVKLVHDSRYSISTWFRDDEIDCLV